MANTSERTVLFVDVKKFLPEQPFMRAILLLDYFVHEGIILEGGNWW